MRRDPMLGVSVWVSSLAVALVITASAGACGGDDGASAPKSTTTAPVEDLDMKPTDFRSLRTMTKVRGFFVDNRLGHLDEALRVANSPTGGVYPVGTVIQLVPQEAMVKRRKGWSPTTNDWEFFFLSTSATGTEILTRGKEDTVNRFGGNCADCHSLADTRFDFVCEQTHGCEPLQIGRDVIDAIQNADPRPS
jgi:hypothetical protein